VTEDTTSASPPNPTLKVTLSSERGIEVQDVIPAGNHIIEVYFEDQKIQEHFLGFDIHIFRLDDETNIDELNDWMNWMLPNGLQVVAPAEFLGGVQEMPAGNTAYFAVELKPGRYAWVSEIPDPASRNMLKEFIVE
jgi:hypothetical protein